MRLSTKIGATLSTAALSGAAVLGGAGVAQAQSLGSLGSSDPAPVVLTVAGDEDAVGGTISNNTEEAVTCTITVSDAEVMSDIEAVFNEGTTIGEAIDVSADFIAAGFEGKNTVTTVDVAANDTEVWAGNATYNPEADFRAGASAQCGEEGAFAYEPGGVFGSLSMGSLGG
ncbi:hypothetical protein [Dietzia lutea]|uniref:DUF11 domain-containing protein n=2 Tax=Dietzia lutea TaxID=546160 RepID=A0A2S1RA24_9ACTN|nr:hypothetical protein [Dietzia lutea]AWH93136.1 hypothetical protein A6035_14205 [Dietzia lutea]